jgi:hypothetical protein
MLSRERNQSSDLPSEVATNASFVPSGESESDTAS